MARIADGLARDFPGVRVRMKHRVGRLAVGEPSVAIAAVSPHRAEAFAACRAAIDRVKSHRPDLEERVPSRRLERVGGSDEGARRGPPRRPTALKV